MPGLEPLGGRFRAPLAAFAVALICADCALSIPYSSVGPHNLHISTATGARTPFAATNAWLEIQRVMPGCRGEVEGEIFLRGSADSIHLPAGRLSNLVFKFRTSSLLGQTARTTSYATLIRPREGYTYEGSRRNARRSAGCRDRILLRARLIEAAELRRLRGATPNRAAHRCSELLSSSCATSDVRTTWLRRMRVTENVN